MPSGDEPATQTERLKVAVSQWGARHHYAIPRMLHSGGCLERLYTDACASKGIACLLRFLPRSATRGALARLRDRVVRDIPSRQITAFTLGGVRMNRRWTQAASHEAMLKCHVEMGKWLSGSVIRHGLGGATGVYTFTVEGLELLTYAASAGIKGYVEQTIAPKQVELDLLRAEQDAFPEWEKRLPANLDIGEFLKRERAEWDAADVIICGSDFVRKGIRQVGGPDAKCAVVPYGYEAEVAQTPAEKLGEGRALRIATVGTVGLRKGTPYVLQAAKLLGGKAEIRVAGSLLISEAARNELARHVVLLGRIPRSQVRELYEWADLFLLPSICEGSATACYEALCHGVPVITTENAGSIVRHGVDGWIVPVRDPAAIAETIEWVDGHRPKLRDFSARALERARLLSLPEWRQRLIGALRRADSSAAAGHARVDKLSDSLQSP